MASKLTTERIEFAQFLALTRERRAELGLPLTQDAWAKLHGIEPTTLSDWKHEPDVLAELKKQRGIYMATQMPKIDAAVLRKAIKTGNYYEGKLLYQRFDDFRESSDTKMEVSGTLTLSQWLQSDESTTVHSEDPNSASLVS